MKHQYICRFALLAVLVFLVSEPAHAMHIMEGYLPLSWCGVWYAISLPFVVWSYLYVARLVRSHPRERIRFALSAAFVFVLSAIKLPSVTGSSSHLTGTSLGTLTTSPLMMPLVGFVVLLFQALLLAHGGISTLGANIFSLSVVGPVVAYLVYKGLMSLGVGRSGAIFCATFLGSLSTYVTTSVQLALVFPDPQGGMWAAFVKFVSIFAITQIPLSLVEGAMTVGVIRLIERSGMATQSAATIPHGRRSTLWLSLLAGVCLLLPILAGYVEIGEGTDDGAGNLITQLRPDYQVHQFFTTFDPGSAEPWLFALQVAIGIAVFALGYRLLLRRSSASLSKGQGKGR